MGQEQLQALHLQSVLMAVIRDGAGAASGPSPILSLSARRANSVWGMTQRYKEQLMEERNDNFGKRFGKEQMKPQVLWPPSA